jgi:hypothetical protein
MIEVRTARDLDAAYGKPAAVLGTLKRVQISKGPQAWEGAGLVLDDGEVIYVSYRDPPRGWSALLGAYLRVEGELTRQSQESEQSLIAPHLVRFTEPQPSKRQLAPLAGAKVTLTGRAANVKAGAVVLVDGEPISAAGLTEWPREASGKELEVTGTLRSGTGNVWSLEQPEWRRK